MTIVRRTHREASILVLLCRAFSCVRFWTCTTATSFQLPQPQTMLEHVSLPMFLSIQLLRAMLFHLLQLVLLAVPAQSECNEPRPISLPVTDVLLSNGNHMRGVLASIGTPPQNISFFPKVYVLLVSQNHVLDKNKHGLCQVLFGLDYTVLRNFQSSL